MVRKVQPNEKSRMPPASVPTSLKKEEGRTLQVVIDNESYPVASLRGCGGCRMHQVMRIGVCVCV